MINTPLICFLVSIKPINYYINLCPKIKFLIIILSLILINLVFPKIYL